MGFQQPKSEKPVAGVFVVYADRDHWLRVK
jgi:hypothetical protein